MRVRRRRIQPGHVRRDAQPGGAVAAAGGVHGHQQPVRHGHRARPPLGGDRPAAQGREPRRAGHALRRHGRARHPRGRGEAVERVREERRPLLVEAVTYRFRGHSMADPEQYRTKEEVAHWRERDPIPAFGSTARARGRDRRGRARAHRRARRSRASTRRSSSPTPRRSRRPSRCTTTCTCSGTQSRGWYSVRRRPRGVRRGRGGRDARPRPRRDPQQLTDALRRRGRTRGAGA